jgi:hypothetical protein
MGGRVRDAPAPFEQRPCQKGRSLNIVVRFH